MKAALILIVLVLALPLAAFADGINLTNRFGSIAISNAGITSTQSQLTSFNGIVAAKGHSLGSVTFSTGPLISGSISAGGTFSSVGSTFVVDWKSKQGVPRVPSLRRLHGSDYMDASQKQARNVTYTLSGTVSGRCTREERSTATLTETIFSTRQQLNKGIGHIRGGTTGLATPEPTTLSLLGTGLIVIAGLFKRKFSGSEPSYRLGAGSIHFHRASSSRERFFRVLRGNLL